MVDFININRTSYNREHILSIGPVKEGRDRYHHKCYSFRITLMNGDWVNVDFDYENQAIKARERVINGDKYDSNN